MIALPSPRNARLQTLQRQALRETLCVAPAYAALAVALGSFADFGAAYVFKAAALFAGASWLLWQTIGAHAPHTRFGAANRVTLLRLALVLLIAAAAGESVAAPHLAWGVVGLATSAALLDAMDGPLARASGLASEFGARFDMETDALLVLTLSVLAWQFDRAGAWVFAAGLMRYTFVAASHWPWPWLARPLPPSLRRKAVCVAQIVSLIVCLVPWLAPRVAGAVAAAGVVLLTCSFAVDVHWLARARHLPQEIPA